MKRGLGGLLTLSSLFVALVGDSEAQSVIRINRQNVLDFVPVGAPNYACYQDTAGRFVFGTLTTPEPRIGAVFRAKANNGVNMVEPFESNCLKGKIGDSPSTLINFPPKVCGTAGAVTETYPPGSVIQRACFVNTSEMRRRHRVRTYDIAVPSVRRGKPGLVIALHGGGGGGTNARLDTKLDQFVNQYNFVAVFPYAQPYWRRVVNSTNFGAGTSPTGRNWNDVDRYRSIGKIPLDRTNGPDDPQFIYNLTRELVRRYNINQDRIYVLGHSNGGTMTDALALDPRTGPYIAAVAISGSDRAAVQQPLTLNAPMSALIFRGGWDNQEQSPWPAQAVPYVEPDLSELPALDLPDDCARFSAPGAQNEKISFLASLDDWMRDNGGYSSVSNWYPVEDYDTNDNTVSFAIDMVAANGASISSVLSCYGGHTWPNSQADGDNSPQLSGFGDGYVVRDFDGTTAALEFFKAHKRIK